MKRKQHTHQDPRLVEIYENLEEIFATKGPNSLWPNTPFKHKFGRGAKVLGVSRSGRFPLKKGDLVIRSKKGKKLWKFFDY